MRDDTYRPLSGTDDQIERDFAAAMALYLTHTTMPVEELAGRIGADATQLLGNAPLRVATVLRLMDSFQLEGRYFLAAGKGAEPNVSYQMTAQWGFPEEIPWHGDDDLNA